MRAIEYLPFCIIQSSGCPVIARSCPFKPHDAVITSCKSRKVRYSTGLNNGIRCYIAFCIYPCYVITGIPDRPVSGHINSFCRKPVYGREKQPGNIITAAGAGRCVSRNKDFPPRHRRRDWFPRDHAASGSSRPVPRAAACGTRGSRDRGCPTCRSSST